MVKSERFCSIRMLRDGLFVHMIKYLRDDEGLLRRENQQDNERGEMIGMKKIIVSLLIIITLLSLSACVNRVEKYTSPSGNNKITVFWHLG